MSADASLRDSLLRGSTTKDPLLSIRELEAALVQALAERDDEVASVEDELARLSKIYERMRGDVESIRQERDRALDAVREERERRTRETFDLTERLHEARRRESTDQPVDAAALRERFVAERLAAAPVEHLTLADGAAPEVPGFEMIAPLGRGGMATVFRARRKADGAHVAVKLLRDGAGASRSRTELFLREAAVMLQLDHPGLVGAVDAGECAYGRYLVMELVEGESLSAKVRRDGPMHEIEAVDVAVQVARALSYCSRLGLTHRDVKPSNALLAPDGRVRVCDFGLAALTTGADPARPYGSPGYASPEQLATPTDVDERADIYGLGCTLWHLVVGRRPFPGQPKQAFEDARTTDLPDPRFEGADISPRLALVIRRMGRVDRAKRYRRWDECLLDLILVQQGNPPFSAHFADARETAGAASSAPHEVESTLSDADDSRAPAAAPAAANPARRTKAAETTESAPTSARTAAPPAATSPSTRNARIAAAIAAAALLACGVSLLGRSDPVAEMRKRAHALAESGRAEDAARSLREAADIAPPDAAAELRREADAIEKK